MMTTTREKRLHNLIMNVASVRAEALSTSNRLGSPSCGHTSTFLLQGSIIISSTIGVCRHAFQNGLVFVSHRED